MNARFFSDMTNEQYHSASGHSSTQLKKLIEITPQKFMYDTLYKERAPNKYYDLGSFVHGGTLEKERLHLDFVIMPTFNPYTKQGKADKAAFLEANKGKTIISEEMQQQGLAMIEAIENHRTAAALLDGTLNEQSIFWEFVDEETQTEHTLRVRPDALGTKHDCIVDLKTCESAVFSQVQKDMVKFKYALSAVMYMWGVNLCKPLLQATGIPHYSRFVFIFVEREAPYQIALYELGEDMLQAGRVWLENALFNLVRAKAHNWPTYPDHIRIVDAPPWAKRLTEI